MATKKTTISTTTTEKKIEIYQDPMKYGFWKRLPYTLTEEQQEFVRSIYDKKNIAVFCEANAGCSKTTLAVATGILMHELGMADKIYYVISPCQSGAVGFLPGDYGQKISLHLDGLRDALLTCGINPDIAIFSENNMESVKTGDCFIEAIAHSYIRGRNFQNAYCIIDEAQDFTEHELRKTLTRCHDSTKVVVCGNIIQTDLKYKQDSGFPKFLSAAEKEDFIKICKLTHDFRGRLSKWADEVR